ncbi:MAG: hypothetical protein KC464_21700 [Myxococcales bacterium]|nr:hypothetical protein [Myxococcales bacterium]
MLKRQWSKQTLLLSRLVVCAQLVTCTANEQEQLDETVQLVDVPDVPPVAVPAEFDREYPAPHSVVSGPTTDVPTTTAEFLAKMLRARRPQLNVFAGTVTDQVTLNRRLGNSESGVATAATVTIDRRYCGSAIRAGQVEVLYPGGRRPDGTNEYVAEMSPLTTGASYVFLATFSGDDLVVWTRSTRVLRLNGDGAEVPGMLPMQGSELETLCE